MQRSKTGDGNETRKSYTLLCITNAVYIHGKTGSVWQLDNVLIEAGSPI